MSTKLIIRQPTITRDDQHVCYRAELAFSDSTKELWFKVEKEFEDFVSTSSNAALVAVLFYCMEKGIDIEVEGTISAGLYSQIRYPLQKLLLTAFPGLKHISILASSTVPDKPNPDADAVLTGFSGGVDSFCVLKDYYYQSASEHFKLTHLLFNNVGSHGLSEESHAVFRKRAEQARIGSRDIGLPLIIVDTNLHLVYRGKYRFINFHTILNLSVALLLAERTSTWLYASAYDYAHLSYAEHGIMAKLDPALLALTSMSPIKTVSSGSEFTRFEKIGNIVDVPLAQRQLDVCVAPENAGDKQNCGKCWKCARTLLALEALGSVEQFEQAFDLSYLKTKREKLLGMLAADPSPLSKEIIKHLSERSSVHSLESYVWKTAYQVAGLLSLRSQQ